MSEVMKLEEEKNNWWKMEKLKRKGAKVKDGQV